jgi:hypothetical protein
MLLMRVGRRWFFLIEMAEEDSGVRHVPVAFDGANRPGGVKALAGLALTSINSRRLFNNSWSHVEFDDGSRLKRKGDVTHSIHTAKKWQVCRIRDHPSHFWYSFARS